MGGAAGTGGGGASVMDPGQAGPYAVTFVDANISVATTESSLDVRCFLPESEPGPFPLVTFAHGFQLPISQYVLSAGYLATFGFVVCLPDYSVSMFSPSHLTNAQEVIGTLDWALDASSPVADKIDPDRVGATGHSLGGKLSVIAASMDSRIKAVIGLDPVDTSTNCSATDCPDASALLPLGIPTAFVGETLDATGTFQACAPEADNFETFYASAGSPSLKVHVDGANHMSFLDDPDSCGITCSFCKTPTRDHEEVISLARSYLAAFFLRYLTDNPAYDEYLSGPTAQQRYVQTGIATIESK